MGNIDVVFYGATGKRITVVVDLFFIPGFGFKLYSLHAVQRTHMLVSDAAGVHTIGTGLSFPRSSNGSH